MSHHNPPVPPRQPLSHPSSNSVFPPPYSSPASFQPNMGPQSQHPQYKRLPQFSPGAQSPVNSPHFTPVSLPRGGSPLNGAAVNGFPPAPPAPGSMGPPSRPVDKATDIRTLEDPLAGTGVNLDEEERNLTSTTYHSQQHGINASLGSQATSFGPSPGGTSFERPGFGDLQNGREESFEELQRRTEVEADFRAGRWAQHPLWDAFLQGDPLERRLNKCSYENGIKSPKDGLFYATKGQARPQTTRVTGHDGASQVIDRGQTILSTDSGDVLGDMMKLIALATKDRVTGLLDHSARLACERRDHSAGRVPTAWKTVAVIPAVPPAESQSAGSPAASMSLKRTFSQMDEEQAPAPAHRIVSVLEKIAKANRASEQARLAKRAKRYAAKPVEAGGSSGATTPTGAQTPLAAHAEPEKRLTKKDRKAVQDKMSDAQQQKSANETARMAMGLGSSGKFRKQYSWLKNGNVASPAASPGQTPQRGNAAVNSAASTPGSGRTGPSVPRGKQLGEWNENEDRPIQARDVLSVLESDGKAVQALSKGYNTPEKPERK